ncbi:MAG: tRNA epoxyqueuosine(34) reductase QueG [Zoogloeaceae bacterium]|jgi:epoxyqueuosine reductase|nr:tRNA epoxyqueuosine(34) reductase QueG [Zoogloeaceae bacterium]
MSDSLIDSLRRLFPDLRRWAQELDFSEIGMAPARVDARAAARFQSWLAQGGHGEMDYMARHADLRLQPELLFAQARSVFSVALDYWPENGTNAAWACLARPEAAYISRYALGRDYHKLLRQRLEKLARRMEDAIGPFRYRVFADSAPVLEVPFALQGGLGWRGKHGILVSRQGSWRFLGEMYTDLPFFTQEAGNAAENVAGMEKAREPEKAARAQERAQKSGNAAMAEHWAAEQAGHCGTCDACMRVCPTRAIVRPGVVDARRCISYLTIELPGLIPEALRPLLGNRVYGCDDCQLVCPWNRFARLGDPAFHARPELANATLVDLLGWSVTEFEQRLAGSPIRRIGHERWQRNIAVALGNLAASRQNLPDSKRRKAIAALKTQAHTAAPLARAHILWALARLEED